MLYLIVPPIIIVLAIAILIVFLVRILPSEKNKKHVTTKNEKKVQEKLKKSKSFFKKKGGSTKNRIKKTLETTATTLSKGKKKMTNSTQGITMNGDGKNVVSLRKKSMVSDKIDDGEDRDIEEVSLMKEIENEPQNSKKYESLGDYYMEHEKFEDARDCYKYVLRLDPHHKRAQVAMRNLDRVLH